MKRYPLSLAAVAATAATLCVVQIQPAVGADASFTVSSSLDGKQVLPARSHWLATTDLAPAQLDRVEFVIDGTVRWVEHKAPYNYASDDNGKNLGWLVTSWLSPGAHRFVVRAFDKDGQQGEDAVTARVLPHPAPPTVLTTGTWQRVDKPTAILWFDRTGLTHAGADGTGVVYDYDVHGSTISMYGVVVAGVQQIEHGACNGNGCKRVKRLGRVYEVFGNDCNYAGPSGRYRWSVTGDVLTLTAVHEGCPGRGGFLAHEWRRVQ
jgi:hypothetical protein